MDKIIVLCTINDFNKAKEISKYLLERKLIACSNIIPQITSMYVWNGEIACDDEYLMLLKSKSELFEELKFQIKKLHPYEVAEIISVKIDNGSNDYLDWIEKVVKS